MDYREFIKNLDKKLALYFKKHESYIQCKKGCSACCENGDYPLSQVELEYLMQGYIALSNEQKQLVQENLKRMEKGKACPFLLKNECSVYKYRPIICRVHGLAYLYKDNVVKVPYCVHEGKNYYKVYKDDEIEIQPIEESLDSTNLLSDIEYGEIRNLYDWLK